MAETIHELPKTPEDVNLTLSDAAVKKVQTMLLSEDKQGCGLRVDVVPGGCAGMSYDLRFQKKSYDNDIIIPQDGFSVFVNPQSAVFLKGSTIDYKDTLKESGFQYINPNASSSCGCGLSFS